jgi:hypothetical protein
LNQDLHPGFPPHNAPDPLLVRRPDQEASQATGQPPRN